MAAPLSNSELKTPIFSASTSNEAAGVFGSQRTATCDLLKSLTINDYRGEDEEDQEDDEDDLNISESGADYQPSPDEKQLRKLNKVILQMEQKLKELKSEKCNLLLRINCNQTEQFINKKN